VITRVWSLNHFSYPSPISRPGRRARRSHRIRFAELGYTYVPVLTRPWTVLRHGYRELEALEELDTIIRTARGTVRISGSFLSQSSQNIIYDI
jgi:hypothetical protein